MKRVDAIASLSERNAEAIRLADGGASAAEIAVELGVPAESVEAFLRVARAKLDHALAEEQCDV